MPEVLRGAQEMVAGMTPVLMPGQYVFCSTDDALLGASGLVGALASFREAEGLSLILPLSLAEGLGFDCALVMACITLTVFSSLEGTGLTAAVAGALAEVGIPCNMVAAMHHDHVFVPVAMADRAMEALLSLQQNAGAA